MKMKWFETSVQKVCMPHIRCVHIIYPAYTPFVSLNQIRSRIDFGLDSWAIIGIVLRLYWATFGFICSFPHTMLIILVANDCLIIGIGEFGYRLERNRVFKVNFVSSGHPLTRIILIQSIFVWKMIENNKKVSKIHCHKLFGFQLLIKVL